MARILPYGTGSLELPRAWRDLPELRPPGAAPLDDPSAAVRQALACPLGSEPLSRRARGSRRVAILVADRTRPSGTEVFFAPLLEELAAAGVTPEQITVIFARGIHRRQTREEQERILGGAWPRGLTVLDHDASDEENLVEVGTTRRGTRVRLNRLAVEADLRVVTGTVGFHYFAGFGGGRKTLFPGVAAAEAIAANHLRVLNPTARGRAPGVRAGNLEGNPVHEDMEEAALMAGASFLLNTVLAPEKHMLAVYAGDLRQAHREACEFYRRAFCVPIKRKYAAVVVSAGGHPRDVDFIQSHKTLEYAAHALLEGGTMVVLAACPDGLGSEHFRSWLSRGSLEKTERALRHDYQIYGQTAWATLAKSQHFRIMLRSELDDETVRLMGMEPVNDLTCIKLPGDAVLIPFGASTLPLLSADDWQPVFRE